MKYLVTNIKWDTDGEDVDLPTNITVDVDDALDDYQKVEVISDYITDQTGFCHLGFSTEPPLNE